MTVHVIQEDARWEALGLPDRAETAARATLSHLGMDPELWDISLLACNDARIAELNAKFRDKSKPTNVLSWPSEERGAIEDGAAPAVPVAGPDPELGDIALAYETCADEAQAAGKTLADHVTHLIVHGVLHLLGYDHIRDLDATLMETTETAILGNMGIDNPY